MSEALAKLASRPTGFEFSEEQRKLIRDTFLNGASDAEAAVLLEVARVRRLNPITKQIHFIKRWDSMKRAEVWAAQVGIDGLRSIAERTGLYDGQDEPEYEDDGRSIRLCRVKVYRKDWQRPAVGVAYWNEYAQKTKEGALTSMWARGPHFMLAKCAEALALRKAFPEDTSGLYIPEEMGDAPPLLLPEKDVTPAPVRPINAAPEGEGPACLETGKRAGIPLQEFPTAELEDIARAAKGWLTKYPGQSTKRPAMERDLAKVSAELAARMAQK